jgi:hypothetical protein
MRPSPGSGQDPIRGRARFEPGWRRRICRRRAPMQKVQVSSLEAPLRANRFLFAPISVSWTTYLEAPVSLLRNTPYKVAALLGREFLSISPWHHASLTIFPRNSSRTKIAQAPGQNFLFSIFKNFLFLTRTESRNTTPLSLPLALTGCMSMA